MSRKESRLKSNLPRTRDSSNSEKKKMPREERSLKMIKSECNKSKMPLN